MATPRVVVVLAACLLSGCAYTTYSTLAVSGQGPLAIWAAKKTVELDDALLCQGGLSWEERSAQLSRVNSQTWVDVRHKCAR